MHDQASYKDILLLAKPETTVRLSVVLRAPLPVYVQWYKRAYDQTLSEAQDTIAVVTDVLNQVLDGPDTYTQMVCNGVLGECLLYVADLDEARYRTETAIELAQSMLDRRHEAEFMANLGLYYLAM
jgi:hypothetical protein